MDFESGEKVHMILDNEFVGIGCVCRTDPDSTCGGTKIGQGNVSILVEECLKDVVLPFPTMDTSSLQGSLWSAVRWPKLLLQSFVMNGSLIDENKSYNDDEEDHSDPLVTDAIPITSPEFETLIRESWRNQRVLLKDDTMMQTVNEGTILYVFPHDYVNFQELGHDCVGVGIEMENASIHDVVEVGSITLLKWPIKQTTMLDGSPLQCFVPIDGMHARYEDVSNDENVGNKLNGNNAVHLPRKRRYTFINRTQKSRVTPASTFYLSNESIQRVSCIDCCAKKCCQFADRDMLTRLRQEFWGESQKSRTNYVYDVLSICYQKDEKSRYQFKLNGSIVCCRAWYELHGIPKTSFYRYKENFENGVRQYMHGNTCTLRRGLQHTSLARALLNEFVENNSEKMPHRSRTLLDGSRETQLVIPSTYKQVDILCEINTTLDQMGYEKKLSQSSFGRIWNKEYPHVSLTKTSEFSKCNVCSSIKARLEAKPSLEERALLLREREVHMAQQKSCRSLYYAWRTYSETQPQKYVCIIHDKMDQKKTAIPRLRIVPKGVDSGYNLQVALIGMITHGHGEGHYGHFVLNGLWPADPNLTIGSIANCLHNLERIDKHPLGDLVTNGLPRSNVPILHALNSRDALDYHNLSDGKEPIMQPSKNAEEELGSTFRRLPENLLLQLDNCAGENKNRYLFAYLSMLVARGVFKTIQLGFLMVGHTHEDIDAMFSRFSEKLRVTQTYTFPHLMDTLRNISSSSPAPFLLTKIPNFKQYCDGYLCDGQDILVGHSKPLQFRFFMQDETPMMQYKAHVGVSNWSGSIRLWKTDTEGKPMLPHGDPPQVPMAEYVKAHEEVILGLKNYIKFWQNLGNGSSVPRYYRPVIDYWSKVIEEIGKEIISEGVLYEMFWPKTQEYCHLQSTTMNLQQQGGAESFLGLEELNDHFCGPQRDRPREEFDPMSDVHQGDFVMLVPSDTEIYPVWLAMALSDIDNDPTSPNYKKLLIQY